MHWALWRKDQKNQKQKENEKKTVFNVIDDNPRHLYPNELRTVKTSNFCE